MRLFFSSSNAPHQKIHYVSWVTITLPKAKGALGIRKISDVNIASFINLGWQSSTSNSLWSIWFKNRYFKYRPIWSLDNTFYGSCIWRKIRRFAPLIHQGSSWIFDNGQSINAWHDTWAAGDPLSTCFPLQLFPRDQRISSLFRSGTWVIPNFLPPNVYQHLLPLLSELSSNLGVSDTLNWRDTPDGKLSLRSLWQIVRHTAKILPWPNMIWNNISPKKSTASAGNWCTTKPP